MGRFSPTIFLASICGLVGKYGSLLYGVNEVVKDDPSVKKLVLGAAVYTISSIVVKVGESYDNILDIRGPIMKKLNDLEEKLD